jgi:hypothetical protein
MDKSSLLVVAMAQQCRALIRESENTGPDLLPALRRDHLLWMCDSIEKNVESWPGNKLHRWIGFIQGGMLANRILDLKAAKLMFDEAKNAYGASEADQDLLDHLDPKSTFEFDIGGES